MRLTTMTAGKHRTIWSIKGVEKVRLPHGRRTWAQPIHPGKILREDAFPTLGVTKPTLADALGVSMARNRTLPSMTAAAIFGRVVDCLSMRYQPRARQFVASSLGKKHRVVGSTGAELQCWAFASIFSANAQML